MLWDQESCPYIVWASVIQSAVTTYGITLVPDRIIQVSLIQGVCQEGAK